MSLNNQSQPLERANVQNIYMNSIITQQEIYIFLIYKHLDRNEIKIGREFCNKLLVIGLCGC